jgi:hypothetical protein
VASLIYLYGFVGADAPEPPASLRGLAGGAVSLVAAGGVRAVIGRVPAEEYAAGSIDERLGDLRWVGEQGLAHERVVAWFVDRVTILPAPLLTLYSTESALAGAAAARADELRAQMRSLEGQREWDLKVTWDPERAQAAAGELSPEIRALEERIAAANPGAAYLLERKRVQLALEHAAAGCRERAERLLDDVAAHARATERLPLPKTGDDGPVLLYAALLVPRAAEPALIAAVEERRGELERVGMDAKLSGPWAAYRFVGERREPAGR